MVRRDQSDDDRKGTATDTNQAKDEATDANEDTDASEELLARRSVLKLTGAAVGATAIGSMSAFGTANAAVEISSEGDYEVWTVSGKEVYDLSDGEELSNVLIDQTADGACLTIRSRNKTNWTVRNVGFLGVGQVGGGANAFQLQVSAPSGGHGLVENVWANGKARNGQSGTELGGIFVRSSHAGHIDIRHTYMEGFGNNAVYGSAPGKDSGNNGSVSLENCYHRDNTVSQYRIGSPGSSVRNCVGVVDDPAGDRGPYPGTASNQNARGIWGKHFRNQVIENSVFYISPDDAQPDGAFEARYISGRSHGDEAVVEAMGCDVNEGAPRLTGSTSNARVNLTDLGENPTVTVIQNGGVPLSPEMAARGDRSMPPELPGAESSDPSDGGDDTSDGSDDGSTSELDRTLTVDGTGTSWTDYEFTVSGEIAENPDVGTIGTGDSIDGSTASGFVNGGIDGYLFSGDVVDITVDGGADIVVDGQIVDPATIGDVDPTVTTGTAANVTASGATLHGSVENLGGADSADVGFDWRETGTSSWQHVSAGTLSTAAPFSADLTNLATDTDHEFRAVVSASDGDSAAGSSVGFTTGQASTVDRTLTVDGTGTGWTDYEFTVSGEVAENPDVGSLGTGDSIDGSTASGFVNGGVDGYVFSGDIVDISVDGDADVLVDGEILEVDSAVLPNTLVFDGLGADAQTAYTFEVSGELVNDTTLGSMEDNDVLSGSTVSGTVSGDDNDGYRFSGDLVSLELDGEASVIFEDNDG